MSLLHGRGSRRTSLAGIVYSFAKENHGKVILLVKVNLDLKSAKKNKNHQGLQRLWVRQEAGPAIKQ